MKRKTGARGLRAIMEQVMLDVMYRVPSDESIFQCTVTKAAVEEDAPVVINGNQIESKSA